MRIIDKLPTSKLRLALGLLAGSGVLTAAVYAGSCGICGTKAGEIYNGAPNNCCNPILPCKREVITPPEPGVIEGYSGYNCTANTSSVTCVTKVTTVYPCSLGYPLQTQKDCRPWKQCDSASGTTTSTTYAVYGCTQSGSGCSGSPQWSNFPDTSYSCP
jgi:hypothetical protein